jgi:FSR family fosmidomycin resistance protein-like MFS transporter
LKIWIIGARCPISFGFVLVSCAIGTLIGGPLGDKFGRKYVICFLFWSCTIYIIIAVYGFVLDRSIIGGDRNNYFICISAILVYAQELLPKKTRFLVFYGFAFGMGGLGSALLGNLADHTSITYVYNLCAFYL